MRQLITSLSFGAMLLVGFVFAVSVEAAVCDCGIDSNGPVCFDIASGVIQGNSAVSNSACKSMECKVIEAQKDCKTPLAPVAPAIPQQVTPSGPVVGPLLSPDLAQDIKNINQLGTTDVSVLLGRLAGFSFGIIGMLALIMFVWGGFVWMTSAGNPEKIKHAFLIFLWTGAGVFMFFATYAILTFFFTAF